MPLLVTGLEKIVHAGQHIAALQAVHTAGNQVHQPRDEWRGPPPLTLARRAARRCGDVLSVFDECVIKLLAALPPAR